MNDKVTVQLIFSAKLSRGTARDLLKWNKKKKNFKCYHKSEKISYGEFEIIPDKGFNIRVKVRDEELTREVLEELKNGKD